MGTRLETLETTKQGLSVRGATELGLEEERASGKGQEVKGIVGVALGPLETVEGDNTKLSGQVTMLALAKLGWASILERVMGRTREEWEFLLEYLKNNDL